MVEAVPRRRTPDNDDPGPLARALLRLRGERGWMQSDVARRSGLTQPYYSSLETGAILRPRSDKLLALDTAFDLEPGTLERLIRQEQGFGALSNSSIEMTFGPEGEIVALVRRILPAIGDKRLETLAPQDVQAMISRMRAQGYSPTTMHDALSVLRVALKRAERWDLMPRNVAALVDSPTTAPFPCNPLTPDEARRFLVQVVDDRLAALYELAVRLGLRSGELRGLLWADIDLCAGILHVRQQIQWLDHAWLLVPPKTAGSRRSIDLSPHLVAMLNDHHLRQIDERELAGSRWRPLYGWQLVFPNTVGRPIDPASLREQLRRHLAAAALAPRRIHDLRHTAVTLMIAAGVPERVIMEIVGHSAVEMTRLYGHILPPSRRDALARVDALLQGDSRL